MEVKTVRIEVGKKQVLVIKGVQMHDRDVARIRQGLNDWMMTDEPVIVFNLPDGDVELLRVDDLDSDPDA